MPLLLADLDGTLVERDAAFDRWAKAFLVQAALPSSELSWLQLQDRDGRRDKREFFTEIRSRFGLEADVASLVESFRAAFPQCFTLTDEVRDRLARLRRVGWKVAIVSNGSREQQKKIDACGLTPLVDAVAISEAVGSRKPDRAIFQAAARLAASALDDAWVIGDDASADIEGAVRLNLPSIWISRGRAWPEEVSAPTLVAPSCADALDLLPNVG